MTHIHKIIIMTCVAVVLIAGASSGFAQSLQKCSFPATNSQQNQKSRSQPSCSIEISCTDRPVQLGYGMGVCFRATCPGVWALVHKRNDQASFRKRIITYRHYNFAGTWNLRDQGAVESVHTQARELFMVMPDDLIQFELNDPDCNAQVEVINLGYIKKGTVEELNNWFAYNNYMERPMLTPKGGASGSDNSQNRSSDQSAYPGNGAINSLRSILNRICGPVW